MPQRHVLVVDDDRAVVRLICRLLVEEGYRVTAAIDGADALVAAERDSPDMVLLDLQMPVLDGERFVRELRARGSCIPIVLMTGADGGRAVAAMLQARYLAKPFDLDDVLIAVRATFSPC